ncbi:MAG: hypothetical protein ABEK50_10335, partial [bacterium]
MSNYFRTYRTAGLVAVVLLVLIGLIGAAVLRSPDSTTSRSPTEAILDRKKSDRPPHRYDNIVTKETLRNLRTRIHSLESSGETRQ